MAEFDVLLNDPNAELSAGIEYWLLICSSLRRAAILSSVMHNLCGAAALGEKIILITN